MIYGREIYGGVCTFSFSSSPHAILEKLLQHHLEAVKLESKQQASAKVGACSSYFYLKILKL